MNWSWFFPEALPVEIGLPLLALSIISSMITASFGVGGGMLLISVMSLVLPTAVIIPVHGNVQLGSNIGRSLMTWKHIDWATIRWFLPGVILGATLGGLFLIQLPDQILRISIALFVLYICWGPPLPKQAFNNKGIFITAISSSFLTLFVGAHGPLVAAVFKQKFQDRFRTVATMSTALSLQHTAKAIVFGLAGFALLEWLPFILAMILFGTLGTWIGLRFLKRINNHYFDRVFKIFLTLIALRLLFLASKSFLH
jgi:uncharacterized membrane protein YfcA